MDSDPSLWAIALQKAELGLGGLLSGSPCAGQRQWRFGDDHTLCPGSNVEVLMSGNVRCYNIVVDAMKAFPSSENIQAVSCCLLHRLSLGEWPFPCWPDHGVCVGVSLSLGTMLTSAVLMGPYCVWLCSTQVQPVASSCFCYEGSHFPECAVYMPLSKFNFPKLVCGPK